MIPNAPQTTLEFRLVPIAPELTPSSPIASHATVDQDAHSYQTGTMVILSDIDAPAAGTPDTYETTVHSIDTSRIPVQVDIGNIRGVVGSYFTVTGNTHDIDIVVAQGTNAPK